MYIVYFNGLLREGIGGELRLGLGWGALGKISRTEYDPKRVEDGLTSIFELGVFSPALPTVRAYLRALKFRAKGFKDLIDMLLYFTARERGLKFLTRDGELLEFLEKSGEELECVVLEEELGMLW